MTRVLRPLAGLRAAAARHPTAADAALALVVLLATLLPLLEYAPGCGCPPLPSWGYAVVVAECLPLVWRRRLPFVTGLLAGTATAVHGASTLPDPPVAFAGLVAVYTVASHCRPRVSRAAAGIAAAAIAVALVADRASADVLDVAFTYLTFGVAWVLGDSARTRRLYTAALEERARRQEAARAAQAEAALAAERARLARELHDIVAHHVSMMVVQAEAGAVVTRDPELATQTFDGIGRTGRQALTEMRRLLGVLRAGADPLAPTEPQPGLAAVPALVEQLGEAGLPVALEVEGRPRDLPAGVDLSAYRIVQEALTNVLRHAGPARARVRLAYAADALEIEVADDGLGSPPEAGAVAGGGAGGHGLIGMRERVAMFGGELRAGPAPGGGFAVRAVLPLRTVATRADT